MMGLGKGLRQANTCAGGDKREAMIDKDEIRRALNWLELIKIGNVTHKGEMRILIES